MAVQLSNPEGEPVWTSQFGSQSLLLNCPINEILIEGNRGSSKTDTALVDFLMGVGKGWGNDYKGIVFRNEYKHLGDVVAKSLKLFKKVYPTAKFKQSASEYKWIFPEGEELLFRHGKTLKDYEAFHGHEYPWQFFDELTNFPDLDFYDAMRSTWRSPIAGIRKRRIAATNPHGQSHQLVKKDLLTLHHLTLQ